MDGGSEKKTIQAKEESKKMWKMKSNRQQKKKIVDVASCQGGLCWPSLRVSLNHCNSPLNLKRAQGGGVCVCVCVCVQEHLLYSSIPPGRILSM